MENNQNASHKIAVGVVLGSVVGATALYMLYSAQHRQQPLIKKVGKTISNIGEMLENCNFSTDEITHKVEQSLPKKMHLAANIGDLIDMGIKIWKQFK